jgi:hypothetical protein
VGKRGVLRRLIDHDQSVSSFLRNFCRGAPWWAVVADSRSEMAQLGDMEWRLQRGREEFISSGQGQAGLAGWIGDRWMQKSDGDLVARIGNWQISLARKGPPREVGGAGSGPGPRDRR